MRIIVDAMGGDNAPLEILKGCRDAVSEYGISLLLTGDESVIKKCAAENGISLDSIEIKHTADTISMSDHPKSILKEKSSCSMAVGLHALADGEGDAFVSAGSTGALVLGATFIVKRISGIKRVAIASIMPSLDAPFMLLDGGANAECHAEHLAQFAVMGDVYMRKIMNIEKPRIGLANIGTEDTKGDSLRLDTFALLSESKLNFIGNVEARDVPFGCCDVVVTDGFTGNIMLKMYEGVAGSMMKRLKAIFMKNIISKASYLAVKKGLTDFKKDMDYTDYGGAPLLGTSKTVIKAHGSSNAKALKNAIRQALECAQGNVAGTIADNL